MSIISENVIPGNHGKIFGTNATTPFEIDQIIKVVSKIKGVKDVIMDEEAYPKEFTVHSSSLVHIIDIQDALREYKLHALPKRLFGL
jgi:hypothetical protein